MHPAIYYLESEWRASELRAEADLTVWRGRPSGNGGRLPGDGRARGAVPGS
jgi:hypothetical protein